MPNRRMAEGLWTSAAAASADIIRLPDRHQHSRKLKELVEVQTEGTTSASNDCELSSPCSGSDYCKRMDLEATPSSPGNIAAAATPLSLVRIVGGSCRPSWLQVSPRGSRPSSCWENNQDHSNCKICVSVFSGTDHDAAAAAGAAIGSPGETVSWDGVEDANWRRVLKGEEPGGGMINKLPSSQYRGVVPQPNGRWGAQIYEKHQRVWLGTFNREEDAAKAYDRAAMKFRGRDAMTNFRPVQDSDPEAVFLRHYSKEQIVEMLRRHTYGEELEESKRLQATILSRNNNTHVSFQTTAVNLLNQPQVATDSRNPRAGGISSLRSKPIMEREHLFEKSVTPSDVGKLNRLVIPKQHAERCFPLDLTMYATSQTLSFEDVLGKHWRFRYSYWNSSQSYVFTKGWSRFVKEKKLNADDIVSFQRGPNQELYIDFRRRQQQPNNHVIGHRMLPPISNSSNTNTTSSPGSELGINDSWVRRRLSTKPRGLLSFQNLPSTKELLQQLSQQQQHQLSDSFASLRQLQQQQHIQKQQIIMEGRDSLHQQSKARNIDVDFFSLQQQHEPGSGRCCNQVGGIAAAEMLKKMASNSTSMMDGKQSVCETGKHRQDARVVDSTATTIATMPPTAASGSSMSGGGRTRLFGVNLERTSSSSFTNADQESVSSSTDLQSLSRASSSPPHQEESTTSFQARVQHVQPPCFRGSNPGEPIAVGSEQQQHEYSPRTGLSVNNDSTSRVTSSNLQLMSSSSRIINEMNDVSTVGETTTRSELLQQQEGGRQTSSTTASSYRPAEVALPSYITGEDGRIKVKRKMENLEMNLRESKRFAMAVSIPCAERLFAGPNTSLSLAHHSS
ncbi:hypothetical protein R1flu_012475 [Riccia fluitans]|uniref:Uncharacterized protein n=1 Tax=Riccia fluitans TaxID=41844 RepID=A0ABD1ZAY6_9MARC